MTADRYDTSAVGDLAGGSQVDQAEQLFSVLRRRKIPTELVRYPREGHELTRSGEPNHRADHMQRTLEWFERYCG